MFADEAFGDEAQVGDRVVTRIIGG